MPSGISKLFRENGFCCVCQKDGQVYGFARNKEVHLECARKHFENADTWENHSTNGNGRQDCPACGITFCGDAIRTLLNHQCSLKYYTQ